MLDTPTLPTPDDEATAIIGHNNPPPEAAFSAEEFAALQASVDAFVKASDVWAKTPITNETLAGQITDQIAGVRKVYKTVDTFRKANKSFWDAQGQLVQDACNPELKKLETAGNDLKASLLVWTNEQQRIAEAARLEKIRIADEAAAEARRLAMDAEATNSIAARVEAEAAAKAAEKQLKAASKDVRVSAKSGSGGGRTLSTRTRNVCTVDRISQLFAYYREDPRVIDVLLSIANAEANSKDFDFKAGHTIPGVSITQTQTLA